LLKADIANFMSYLVVTVFVVIAIGALIYAQKMAQKEQQKRLILARSKRLLQRVNEIWDIINEASKYINNTDAIDAIIKYYCYCVQQREQLMQQPDTLRLLTQADIFKNQFNPNDIIAELNSDSEIKHCKQSFSKTTKILKLCVRKSLISKESYKNINDHLKLTLLDLEVAAYEKLGDIAGDNKNPSVATNYYKYAKKLLIEFDINFDGKHEHIRDISNKNQILFGNLVKETIEEQIENENAVDEFGFPSNLNVMSGKARKD
jgi:hypothetical protein